MWRRIVVSSFLSYACVSANGFPNAAFETCTPFGVVRGESEENVRSVAAILEDLSPRICARLKPEHRELPRIAVVNRPLESGLDGETVVVLRGSVVIDRYIVLSLELPALLRWALAHELVHWYADGVWDELPIVLEEGVADLIACDLDCSGAAHKRLLNAAVGDVLTDANVRWCLNLPWSEPATLPQEQRAVIYAVGFQLTERLGVERIRELATQSRAVGLKAIPAESILKACGPLP